MKTWVKGAMIGRGSFATVNLALVDQQRRPRQLLVAVKSCLLSQSDTLRWEKEVLEDLGGFSNTIKVHGDDVSTAENNEQFYNLFIEYVPGGTLSHLVSSRGKLPETEAGVFLNSLLQSLHYVHRKGYVHCDLKPCNLLIGCDGRSVKLVDFGLAKKSGTVSEVVMGNKQSLLLRGTPLYMAPESVARSEYEPPSDVWSVGCVLLEMLTGRPAWGSVKGHDIGSLLWRIGVTDELPRIPEELSDKCKDLLSKCLVKDPSKRWTAEMLLDHPFVVESCCIGMFEFTSPIAILDHHQFPADHEHQVARLGSSSSSSTSDPSSTSSFTWSQCAAAAATTTATNRPGPSPSQSDRIRKLASKQGSSARHILDNEGDDGCPWVTVRENLVDPIIV